MQTSWDAVLEAARTNTLAADAYAQTTLRTEIALAPRHTRAREFLIEGSHLHCETQAASKDYFSSHSDPALLIEQLQNIPIQKTAKPRALESTGPTLKEKSAILSELIRRLALDHPEIKKVTGRYTDETKHYSSMSEKGAVPGLETYAYLHLDFQVGNEESSVTLPFEKGSTDIASLFSGLSELETWADRIPTVLQPSWPAPEGELSVWWSSQALAKLSLVFLRALESDTVLRKQSWLSTAKMPALAFQLVEHHGEAGSADVEGTPRNPLVLVNRGKIESLITDFESAQLLQVTPSGNARRETYRHRPTIAPYRPALIGEERTKQPLGAIHKGVAIFDLDVLSFSTRASTIEVCLKDWALIHQGEIGDRISALKIQLDLMDVFASMRLFGTDLAPHPFFLQKQGQELFVQVSTPCAVSPSFYIPGEAPQSHYW